jgi:hypothetical protein
MDPKEEAKAKEKLSDDEHHEAILVTRNRNGDNVTVRYLDTTSTSKEGKWGYRTSCSKTFSARATVEELMEAGKNFSFLRVLTGSREVERFATLQLRRGSSGSSV